MLFCSPPCKNRALDRALWCSPPCKNRALARAFWCGFRENCSPSCTKSWSGSCFFGAPLRAKIVLVGAPLRAKILRCSPPCKNRALARAFWCGFRENCSPSCTKSWSGSCFFGVPLRAKIVLVGAPLRAKILRCSPPCKNRALARAFWCGFRENCSPSCTKSWSGSCFFGVPLRAKNRALDRALWCSPPCKNRALDRARWCSPPCKNPLVFPSVQKSCSLVFPSVPKSCSSLWKLLQTMGQTQDINIYI